MLKHISIKFLPGVAWFFVVVYLLFTPQSTLPAAQDWMAKIYFDKWVHTVLFFVMNYLFLHPLSKLNIAVQQQKSYAIKITLAFIIWGLCTEFIQLFFVPGRAFDIFDWFADSAGIIFAYLVFKRRVLNKL